MLKGRVLKNDGVFVYILAEDGACLVANRDDIHFGILVDDYIFVGYKSGEYTYKRVEQRDVDDKGHPYYFDSRWRERDVEYVNVIHQMAKKQHIALKAKMKISQLKKENIPNKMTVFMIFVLVILFLLLNLIISYQSAN